MAGKTSTFKKLADGSYGVSVRKGETANPGSTISVEKRDGSVESVVLGEMIEENSWGDRIFRIKPKESSRSKK